MKSTRRGRYGARAWFAPEGGDDAAWSMGAPEVRWTWCWPSVQKSLVGVSPCLSESESVVRSADPGCK
jgi:hypothetical protein